MYRLKVQLVSGRVLVSLPMAEDTSEDDINEVEKFLAKFMSERNGNGYLDVETPIGHAIVGRESVEYVLIEKVESYGR